ncbi:MAG TPA: class III poly(R)-hydroxyalkanoic acid synthase subunit PhaC [Arenicellales bacterium]|nr:class III poly(R)-hydroxyalkanoic acid synthase subunit PhaC [Arenicellales bacterium]
MTDTNSRSDPPGDELSEFARRLARGFKVLQEMGPLPSGVSEREAIHSEDKLTLYRYVPPAGRKHRRRSAPLLIVYALVNRPYMMDLDEDRSMIRALVDQGLDVYLVDWGYPDRADRYLSLDDYLNGYLDRCVDVVRERHGGERVNILGVCQGGTFSLCYTALHPQKVGNLVTMVTPVDFHTADNLLSRWTREVDVDLLVDTFGNVPGEFLNWVFLALKPFQLMGSKYLDMVDALADERSARSFMLMEKWIFDSPDQAGEAFRDFVKTFFQGNGFVSGTASVGGRPVELARVTMPVLNIYATRDHLVPPEASRALRRLVGTSDYTELAVDGGHIGIYVGSGSRRKVPPAIADWLSARP